jgi:hypothetical protein
VNVIARNVDDPFVDAVSAISSDFTDDFTPGAPLVGTYTINGLTPGAAYAVYVDEIWQGGFSTPPLQPLPAEEEAYNGPNESSDPNTDTPNDFTPVPATAGSPMTGIDIIFSKTPPGPLQLDEDSFVQLFLPFKFKFCGQEYDNVYVNANGNLTFGAPSQSYVPNPREHLSGPPRIAPFWADFSPNLGGVVSFDETANTLRVSWSEVPEYRRFGANSFTVTLYTSRQSSGDDDNDDDDHFGFWDDRSSWRSGHFTFSYGDMTAALGLAGYSCGGKVTTSFEKESDISKEWWLNWINLRKHAAVYEWFWDFDNDLANQELKFRTPQGFRDRFEPNNTIAQAERIHLPFSTEKSFRVKAGQILLVETLPDAPDTMIGLFDTNGKLLFFDDDSLGVGGPSQLLVQVEFDGELVLGITTWPDFDFTGSGSDFGRYVLSVRAFSGQILKSGLFGNEFLLGDDDFAEVQLENFKFPFQGTRYSSFFVNSNGMITFGQPDPYSFIPRVWDLLDGPPRIAPYWDDLSPSNFFSGALQGLVLAEQKRKSVIIHYVGVPEFLNSGTNTFSVSLDKRGKISFDYGPTNRSDPLVGTTEGGGAADPGPTDLSKQFRLSNDGTTYEQFLSSFEFFGGDDLSFKQLQFKRGFRRRVRH